MAVRDVTPEEMGMPSDVGSVSAQKPSQGSGSVLDQDVAEEMHTFQSIDKKNYFENPDADLFSRMQQADATVFQGNFLSEAGERVRRGFTVGGLNTLSDLAELTGDAIVKTMTPADNPRANIFGHKVRNFGFHLQKQADALLEERRKLNPIDEGITPTGFATDVVSSTLTNIGLVAGGTMLGVTVGAPVATAAAVARVGVAGAYGAQAGLEQYSGARAAGNTFESSLAYGIASGVLNTGLELVGLNKVFKTTYVNGVGIVTRRVAEAMAAEGITEGLQQDVGIAIDKMSGADKGRELSLVDMAAQTIYASAVGAVSGGGMAAAVSIPQRAKAISILKQAGMDDAKAKEVYKSVSQEVMDVMHKDLTDEFGFDDAQNMVVQKAMDKATGYRVSEYLKRQDFARGDFEQQLSEMDQADPARDLLAQIKMQAAATIRGDEERMPNANIPGSSDAFAAQETLKKAEAFQNKPVADLQVKQPEFNASTTEEMRLAITGRINFINQKVTALQKEHTLLQKEVDRLESEIGAKQAEKLGTKELEAELTIAEEKENKVANDIVRNYAEAEAIRSHQEGTSLKGTELQIKTRDLIRVTSGFAQRILQAANANFKAGVTASKAEMRFIRQTLNSLINVPGLSRDARAVLKSQFRNLDTAEKLYKNMPVILMNIQDAQNEALIGSFLNGVDKIVDLFKGKEGAGRGGLRSVKLDAVSQKVADAFVKEYAKEDANPAERLQEAGSSAIGAVRLMAAQLKSGKNAVTGRDLEPADYASIYETLHEFAKNGRDSKLFDIEVEKETMRMMIEKITKDILGDKTNIDREYSNADWVDLVLSKATNTFGTYGGFTGLIARHGTEILGTKDTETERLLSVDTGLRKAEALNLFFRGEVDRAYLEAYPELKGDINAIYEKRQQDSDINGPRAVSISFVDEKTKTQYDFNYTREEAMEKYMISQRPEGEIKLRKDGWTDEGLALLRDSLSASDMKFVEAKFKIYAELYDRLNEVFRKLAGYDLPRSKNYSPLITERDTEDGGSLLAVLYNDGKSQAEHMASLQSSGFLQTVTNAKVRLQDISSVDKLNKYIRDVTHYIGTAETINRLQAIYGNREIKSAIKSRYGDKANANLKRYLNVLVKNTVSSESDRLFSSANRAITRLAQGLIAAKPFQVIKQMTSAFAGAEVMGLPKYFEYLSTLPEAMRTGEVRVLTDSAYLRNRSQMRVIDRDTRAIQEMMELDKRANVVDLVGDPELKKAMKEIGRALDKAMKNPTFNNLLFLPTQLGDIGGLLMSTWPVYKHYLAQGDTPEVAKMKAISHANSTQQSGDFTQLPAWMLNANPLQRLFTLFTQAPYQYMNRALRVMQRAGTDRWDWDEFAKMYAVFFLVLPALFDYVSNVFKLDKDARLYAAQKAALGPFDELVIAGPVFEWAVVNATAGLLTQFTGEEVKAERPKLRDFTGLAGTLAENVGQAQAAFVAVLEEGASAESVLKLTTELSEALLPLTGSAGGAVRQVSNSLEGLVLGSQGELVDTWRRYFMTIGASRNITKETK